MLTYTTLQDRPRDFLAATGLTHEEYLRVLPAFVAAYTACYPLDKTWHGKVRQRKLGGGAKGRLAQVEDKLLFILVYQKTNPLQTMHGLHFGLSQPQTHYWQGHLVFGCGVAKQEENELRVLSYVGRCFPGTLHMSQNPFSR